MGVTAECKRNTFQNGVEIYFSSDPGSQIKTKLISNNWRYHGKKRCWYIYFTEKNLSFAEEIVDSLKPKREKSVDSLGSVYGFTSYRPVTHSIKEIDHSMAPIDRPLGRYMAISPKDERYKKKRSFFS